MHRSWAKKYCASHTVYCVCAFLKKTCVLERTGAAVAAVCIAFVLVDFERARERGEKKKENRRLL